jgi:hypothetical protein
VGCNVIPTTLSIEEFDMKKKIVNHHSIMVAVLRNIAIQERIKKEECEMRNTKTGALIGAGTPDRTSLAQANENRIKLGLPPFKSKFDEVYQTAVTWKEFLTGALYLSPLYALLIGFTIFLITNAEKF